MRKFGPFDTSVFYEVENRRLQRAFNPQTGFVKTGQGAVTAGTGAELIIAAYPDGALIDGLYVENPASETVTLSTNTGSTNPRIDRLVMRLDMNAKTIEPFQIVGTPAASPQAPPLVQTATTYDMPLCRYTMPGSASAQNPTSIVDERLRIGGAPEFLTAGAVGTGATAQPSAGDTLLGTSPIPPHRPGTLRFQIRYTWTAPGPALVTAKLQYPAGTDVPGSSTQLHNRGSTAPQGMISEGYMDSDGTARTLGLYLSSGTGGNPVSLDTMNTSVWLI